MFYVHRMVFQMKKTVSGGNKTAAVLVLRTKRADFRSKNRYDSNYRTNLYLIHQPKVLCSPISTQYLTAYGGSVSPRALLQSNCSVCLRNPFSLSFALLMTCFHSSVN